MSGAAIRADVVSRIKSRLIRRASCIGDIGGATGAADVLGAVFKPVADEDAEGNAHYNTWFLV